MPRSSASESQSELQLWLLCDRQREIMNDDFLMFKGKKCCPHHFNCKMCGIVLTKDARDHNGNYYCGLCYEKVTLSSAIYYVPQGKKRPPVACAINVCSRMGCADCMNKGQGQVLLCL